MRKCILGIVSVLFVLLIFAACNNGKNIVETQDVADGTPSRSIVSFNKEDKKCQKLIEDFKSGNIPISLNAMYDEMGSRPEVIVTDKDTIIELYNLFAQITVDEKTNESVTDAYHYVVFTLSDNTQVSFNFEHDVYLCSDGNRYKIGNSGPFFKKIREMQDEQSSEI